MNHKVLKKLSLDKESISTLNNVQMDATLGGSGDVSAAVSAAASYVAAGALATGTGGTSTGGGALITGACSYIGYNSCDWVNDGIDAVNDWFNYNTWSNNFYQNSTNSLYREYGVCMLPDVVVYP